MAGARGGLGRIAAMAIGLGVILALVLVDAARAESYAVAQCGWGVGVELDPAVPKTEGAAAYLHTRGCTAPAPGAPAGLEFITDRANKGEQGVARARWVAPPGTTISGARFTWSGALALVVWQVAGFDDGTGASGLFADVGNTPPHQVGASDIGPAKAFEVRLECLILGTTYGCNRSVQSTMWMSELTLTVEDPVPPQAKLGGDLAGPGWHRGTVSLELGGEDPAGGGIYRAAANVDGVPVLAADIACAVATIEGEVRAVRLRPCPPTASRAVAVDTTAFADGVHALRGCAADFGGNLGCAAAAQIQVDNSPPEVEFSAAPEGQVAATVTDAFSGPAAGTIAVRRADSDSWADIPTTLDRGAGGSATLRARLPDLSRGAWFFRATATDGAGNAGSAQFRAAGTRAGLRRAAAGGSPGSGAATHLTARLVGSDRGGRAARAAGSDDGGATLTVPFGSAVGVRGRLTDAHGGGVAGRAVAVAARPPAGAALPPERRRVVTDEAGHFALRLAPGTSRRVLVSFRGGAGLAPARARPLALRVRAAVSLAASPHRLRTGDSVIFSGRVRPGPARIPARGKLVAVQYLERSSGRWRPALVVRTGSRGRFKARYRFRYITGAARIRLRATALPEAGWPYASGSSTPVTLEVRG
ncbi:MAG: hypothetical protein JSU06_01260 [Actinobacteria bacterium]|nr:hypothetical protein [Actinomycetota bacterium]